MSPSRQDLTHAFRRLSKSPGFAAAAIVSIALGIAANATTFSMVSKLLLRPAPVGDPASLLTVYTTERGECCNNFSWPLYTGLRDQTRSFSAVSAYVPLVPASIGGSGEPERVWGQSVTANFFDAARIPMTLGRGFRTSEEHLPVAVLSHRLWQRRFAADPRIAGASVTLSGRPFTVVGVAPPSFRGLDLALDAQFWIPLGEIDRFLPNMGDRQSRSSGWLQVAARLKPGVPRAQAAAELGVLGRRLARAYPDAEKDRGFRLEAAGSLPPKYKSAVMLFLGSLTAVVLLVLSIACANVANLLLAQAAARRREMAVRLALGASRGRLLRQMLTESVLLAVTGGVFGTALAFWATRALSAFRPPLPVPLDLSVGLDWRVLLYSFALSLAAGLVFGLVSASAAWRAAIANALKGDETLTRFGHRFTLRNVLIVSQVAMSLVLLCATGLFLRSLRSAAGIDIGFRSHDLLMMSVDPQLHGYTAERTTRFLDRLRRRVAALPGVRSAACTDLVPLSVGGRRDGFHVEGAPASAAASQVSVDLYMVTPGYFETMGIPLLAGRDFTRESSAAPAVAVVNQAFAQRLFPHASPIGRRVAGPAGAYQVIGVVGNTKSRTLGEELRPVLYRLLAQDISRDPSFLGYALLARTSGGAASVAGAMRREIRALDPTLAIFNAQTMDQHLRDALFLPRLAGLLFGVFGFAGLLLAAVGLYGVMSYSVSRRTREIGIRLALGGQTGGVQRLIVRQGMRLTGIALALGLAAAWTVAKVFTAVLYGVRPHDPATFTIAPLFLAAVALLACWLPARRAARVHPLTALRHE